VMITAGPDWTVNTFAIGLTDNLEDLEIDPNHWVLTRSFATIEPQLTACLAYNGAVSLNWNSYAADIPLAGYNVYRKALPDGNPTLVNSTPIMELSYTDLSVTNGITYEYYICAVDNEAFCSIPSNRLQATPVSFPFDLGFLVMDETRSGNGSAFAPTDQQVDDFYDAALQGFGYTQWDLDIQGPPSITDLAHYPLILWHSDDFSEIHLLELQDLLGSYVLSGGKLILSGWKHPSVFSDGFIARLLPGITPTLYNSAVFVSAQSDSYPDLYPDPLKLAGPWNGMLPMAYTFPGATEALYAAQMLDGGAGTGDPAAIRVQAGGELVLLGFPLYFMLPDGVRGFLLDIIPDLYPNVEEADELAVLAVPALNIHPNPRRSQNPTSISIKHSSLLSLDLYNLRGQKIMSLNDLPSRSKGSELIYELPAAMLDKLPSGLYIIKAQTSQGPLVRRLTLLN